MDFNLCKKTKNILYNFIIRYNRIVIISFPKSGRTWLQVMLSDLSVQPTMYHGTSKFDKMKTPSTVYASIPKMYPKSVVFITRDPRDVVVSNYYYTKDRKKLHNMELSEFLRDEKTGIEKILTFNLFLLENKDQFKDFMHITYEGMREDTVGHVRRCLSFMRIPFIKDSKIENVVAARQFKKMQKAEQQGVLYKRFGKIFSKGGTQTSSELKLRSGKVGDYKTVLSQEDIAFCDEMIAKHNYPSELLSDD